MQKNSNKCIYIITDDDVVKKEVKGENSTSKKLDRLRKLIVEYTKIYEIIPTSLIENSSKREDIKEIIDEWIDSTIRDYETNYRDSLDLIIAYYEFKLSAEGMEKSKTKVKKT